MGIKALVIEDSLIYQRVMGDVLRGMEGIDEVGLAGTGARGLAAIDADDVDVVFLDINLPDMNGLEILKALKQRPSRPDVIVVSAAGGASTDLTVRALQNGALEFIRKPSTSGFMESVRLLRGDLQRALTLVRSRKQARAAAPASAPRTVAPAPSASATRRLPGGAFWITAVAVSTGGPESLGHVIPRLPVDYPTPIVIVQHMPPVFTRSLAASLDAKSALRVVEAEESMRVRQGVVYIAPGGRHMTVRRESGIDVVRLNDDASECNVRPAADVLFRSLADIPDRSGVLALVMTGMGQDGTAGVTRLKQGRCVCISQAGPTCVVYGMPRAVDEAGLSDESVALDDVARRLTELHSPVRA